MRLYETAFLIVPNLPEDETEQLIQQMADVVAEKKGRMVDVDKWGKRRLAYRIDKYDAAFYVFFHYEGEPDIPAELERRFKQTEAVIRYLTIKQEDEPKVRRRKKKRASSREAPEKKAGSDTERAARSRRPPAGEAAEQAESADEGKKEEK
jgi:small subunit ribosomal protein S6